MIVMISRWKIHPFLSIMVVAFALGIIGGIPLVKSTGAEGEEPVKGIADVIGEGFSGIFTSIGIVIILGTLIGLILERTGGAFRIADTLVRVARQALPRPGYAAHGLGGLHPVFCDSGFVILNPIQRPWPVAPGRHPWR